MRLRLIALGKGTSNELFLMVSEKIDAFEEARTILLRGGDCTHILENYRKIIAAKRHSFVQLEIRRGEALRPQGRYQERSEYALVVDVACDLARFFQDAVDGGAIDALGFDAVHLEDFFKTTSWAGNSPAKSKKNRFIM
jgi:hypothetical protein